VIPAKGDYAARWLQKRVWMRHVKTEKLNMIEGLGERNFRGICQIEVTILKFFKMIADFVSSMGMLSN
jgi:hypothetical protein